MDKVNVDERNEAVNLYEQIYEKAVSMANSDVKKGMFCKCQLSSRIDYHLCQILEIDRLKSEILDKTFAIRK